MNKKPTAGVHRILHPDKYGQLYFLIQQEAEGQWVAIGDQQKKYSLTYDLKNPKKDWSPYFNFTQLSDEQISSALTNLSSEIPRLTSQKSFLEQYAQSQPKCTTRLADTLARGHKSKRLPKQKPGQGIRAGAGFEIDNNSDHQTP